MLSSCQRACPELTIDLTDNTRYQLLVDCVRVFRLARALAVAAVIYALSGPAAHAEAITHAQYDEPVDRYGHFALGKPHEYGRLTVITGSGRALELVLPPNEVFEDLAPRIVSLEPGASEQLLTIVSRVDSGARLALVGLVTGRLAINAQSRAIGSSMRWLNPVGVADLDGDDREEIAAVITPHIGGTLVVYRESGGELVEIAALGGFSNHVYGSPQLALSTPVPLTGRMGLLVPDTSRLSLRVVVLEGGRLVEIGRCSFTARVTGPVEVISAEEILVGLGSGQRAVSLSDCLGRKG